MSRSISSHSVVVLICIEVSALAPLFAASQQSHDAPDASSQIVSLTSRAEAGDVDAQYRLGKAYSDGLGVAVDCAEANRWWTRAAEQGNASAQNELGFSYTRARCVAQDYSQAFHWLRAAAEQGLPAAEYNLARLYEKVRVCRRTTHKRRNGTGKQ